MGFFSEEVLDADKLDRIYDFLEANKVDVLRLGEDTDIDEDLFVEDEMDLDHEEEIDLEKNRFVGARRCRDRRPSTHVFKRNWKNSAFVHGG